MNNQPLLSICIPTYNRVDALKKCVFSIVDSKYYSPDIVEIVISDNASTDGTFEFVKQFVSCHKNIIYNRNDRNIGGDLNFIKVLSIGNGEFLKLHNDYCEYWDEGLSFLINEVKRFKENHMLLFFSIREGDGFSSVMCKDMNSFIRTVTTDVSWIGSFGFWKDDFLCLENKDAKLDTKFMQTDWILRMIERKKSIVVCKGEITIWQKLKTSHGDYNFVELFTTKFPKLFDTYVEKELISSTTYDYLMRQLFIMLMRWSFRLKLERGNYTYDSSGSFKMINNKFRGYSWYYPYYTFYLVWFTCKHLTKISGLYGITKKLLKPILKRAQ